MTKSEAWLQQAELWDKAESYGPNGEYRVAKSYTGLCHTITRYVEDQSLRLEMKQTFASLPNYNSIGHKWPLTKEGAAARAAFCRAQAKKDVTLQTITYKGKTYDLIPPADAKIVSLVAVPGCEGLFAIFYQRDGRDWVNIQTEKFEDGMLKCQIVGEDGLRVRQVQIVESKPWSKRQMEDAAGYLFKWKDSNRVDVGRYDTNGRMILNGCITHSDGLYKDWLWSESVNGPWKPCNSANVPTKLQS